MGLRAAAFLTAGSAGVPFWKFVMADAGAALFGVPLVFGLTYFFAEQIKAIAAEMGLSAEEFERACAILAGSARVRQACRAMVWAAMASSFHRARRPATRVRTACR